jgi:ABC-type multidrug transport system ATPase subunit
LSGGEAARLIFCRIATERPNVLVLDEPTNHLDIEAIGALSEALKAFEGTILFVSHDRAFVSEVATRVLEVTPGGFRDFPGTYAEYLARCGDDHLDADAVVLKAKSSKAQTATATSSATDGGVSWEEQKRKRNRLAALPARRDKLLATIDEAEARRKAIEALYGSDGFFMRTPKDEVERLQREDAELAANIDRWTVEWEAVETEIAALS